MESSEAHELGEARIQQKYALRDVRASRDRPWGLITVLIFLLTATILLSKYSFTPPPFLTGQSKADVDRPSGYEDYTNDTNVGDDKLEVDPHKVELLGEVGDDELEVDPHKVELLDEDAETEATPTVAQSPISKVVVASCPKGRESVLDWIAHKLPDWQPVRYTFDDEGKMRLFDDGENSTVTQNKGREASVYLTYIITHYHNLPDYMVFIHGRRYQSHNDDRMYDTVPEIRNLRLEYVSDNGYASLRCVMGIGCPGPGVLPVVGKNDGLWGTQNLYALTFKAFFPGVPIPKKVSAPCCAQFAVSKEAVLKVPLRRWKKMRRYIYDAHFTFPKLESVKLGLVMEYMWHIIFGKPAEFCSLSAKECYCKRFGLCNLECPTKERCNGRVWTPPFGGLPDGWPKKGQGKHGWPKYGWWKDGKHP